MFVGFENQLSLSVEESRTALLLAQEAIDRQIDVTDTHWDDITLLREERDRAHADHLRVIELLMDAVQLLLSKPRLAQYDFTVRDELDMLSLREEALRMLQLPENLDPESQSSLESMQLGARWAAECISAYQQALEYSRNCASHALTLVQRQQLLSRLRIEYTSLLRALSAHEVNLLRFDARAKSEEVMKARADLHYKQQVCVRLFLRV